MRKATRISLALGTSAALLSLSALPASALPIDDGKGDESTATISVPTGPLTIIVPSAGDGVGFQAVVTRDGLGHVADISVPGVGVTDLRAGEQAWTIGVSLTDFTVAGKTISADGATYKIGNREGAGLKVVDMVDEFRLVTPTDEEPAIGGFTSPLVSGNNSATWDASVSIDVLAEATVGTYTATLTHSVS